MNKEMLEKIEIIKNDIKEIKDEILEQEEIYKEDKDIVFYLSYNLKKLSIYQDRLLKVYEKELKI